MRTRVKICGITKVEDALAAAFGGADAIGWMFYPPSPRAITPEAAGKLRESLPPFVDTVGVFVNPSLEEVELAIQIAGITTVQLHGEEAPDFCNLIKNSNAQRAAVKVIKAARVKDASSIQDLEPYREVCDAWLLDGYSPGAHGGVGASFNWELVSEAKKWNVPVILAGGLDASNVNQAIQQTAPYGIDVSSGVEIQKGVKSATKIAEFLRIVGASAS